MIRKKGNEEQKPHKIFVAVYPTSVHWTHQNECENKRPKKKKKRGGPYVPSPEGPIWP
jgi:hypothetical protein